MTLTLLCIISFGLLTAMVALHGDVAYSNDHPLVKEMGLPL